MVRNLLKNQITFLLFGFVFWLPVALVIYVAVLLFGSLENIGDKNLGVAVPDKYILFGFGVILCVLIVYFSGIILKKTKLGKALSKTPFLELFFGQGEIITINRLTHMTP